jgi:hypothetical protein
MKMASTRINIAQEPQTTPCASLYSGLSSPKAISALLLEKQKKKVKVASISPRVRWKKMEDLVGLQYSKEEERLTRTNTKAKQSKINKR